MANQEQLAILKQGVEVWNKWRADNLYSDVNLSEADLKGIELSATVSVKANLKGVNFIRANLSQSYLIRANLSEANLSEADLIGADLSRANLSNANLRRANLIGADLSRANLGEANLEVADLTGANLTGAYLIGARLAEANLTEADLDGANLASADFSGTDTDSLNDDLILSLDGANLRQANLQRAILRRANLIGTDLFGSHFSKAEVDATIFGNLDLSQALGLENVVHNGPSTIGTDTIVKSKGRIPEVFLRGCGLSDWEIESAKLYKPELSNDEVNKILYKMYDLRATQALQISPLFISYSHGDSTFVDKLESYLNIKGIRFWRDVHDAKAGRLETQVDRAIRQNPTVLLILSEHSLKSDWVEHEVRTARELEKEMGRDVLCPVALDDGWKTSPWPKRVMEQVMEYNILDFSAWEDDSKFGSTFNKLINGLELFYKG